MEHCPQCEHALAPTQTQCPQCRRFCRDKLIDNLRHPDPEIRERAAHDFVFITPDEGSVRALADALNDSVENVRREAGINLFIAGAKAKYVVPELIAGLEHPDVFIRRTSAAALSMVGPVARDALDKLKQFRDSPDEKLRVWVAEALARIPSQSSG